MRKEESKIGDRQYEKDRGSLQDGQQPDWWPERRAPRISGWREPQGVTIAPRDFGIVVVPKRFPLILRCEKSENTSGEDW